MPKTETSSVLLRQCDVTKVGRTYAHTNSSQDDHTYTLSAVKAPIWELKITHIPDTSNIVHDKIKDNKCPHCDCTACLKQSVNKHIKIVHDKIRNNSCVIRDHILGNWCQVTF
jgi:hypothetical protein